MARDLEARMSQNNTPEQQRPASMADQIRSMEEQFQLAMPKGMEAQQLVRDALTCLRQTPRLGECSPASVLGALMTCSQLGLRPGVLGQAWVIPRKNYKTGQMEANFQPGYKGLIQLAQRSGNIKSLSARTVYENDTFDIEYGLNDNLIHKPYMEGERGNPIAYYAVAKYVNGGYNFVYMTHAEVCAHRDKYSQAKTGPWRDNFESMAHKTVIIKLAKWMPSNTEDRVFQQAVAADGTVRVDLAGAALDYPVYESPQGDNGDAPEHIDGEIVDDQTEEQTA